MVKSRPLSPPSSTNGELLQNGFQHLIQHNSNTSFPREAFSYEDGSQLQTTPLSSYGSPPQAYHKGFHHGHQQPMYTLPNRASSRGLGISYEGYSPFTQDSNPYDMAQNDRQMYPSQYTSPAGSCPTSSFSTPGSDAIRTRSGLTINRSLKAVPDSRSRITKSPKPKKTRKGKAKSENRIAKLHQPLSILTKDWDHVPVVDIGAYVNRSAEVRRREVEEDKDQRVKRPMNSFMLYRKAYQLRTKNWCLENNHQVVSQVCGDSWPLEPEELREQFNEWAKIERANHQNAHPLYKFTPSKPGASKAKREYSEEIASEESELDDYDWTRGQTTGKKKPPRQTPKPAKDNQYHPKRSPYNFSRDSSIEPVNGSYNRSSYQASNPGKPLPAQYSQAHLQNGQYYQQTVQNSFAVPGAEDVMIRKTATPGMHYPGVPENQEFDLMAQYQPRDGSIPPDQLLHPTFMGPDGTLFDDTYLDPYALNYSSPMDSGPQWDTRYSMIDPDLQDGPFAYMSPPQQYDNLQVHDEHMQRLKNSQEGWQIVDALDDGPEFDKWMDQE